MKQITIQKVVTKNFITDLLCGVFNMIGHNLTPYEKMIKKGIFQIEEELKQKKIKLKWYRYEMSQLNNGAMAIMLYGERK